MMIAIAAGAARDAIHTARFMKGAFNPASLSMWRVANSLEISPWQRRPLAVASQAE